MPRLKSKPSLMERSDSASSKVQVKASKASQASFSEEMTRSKPRDTSPSEANHNEDSDGRLKVPRDQDPSSFSLHSDTEGRAARSIFILNSQDPSAQNRLEVRGESYASVFIPGLMTSTYASSATTSTSSPAISRTPSATSTAGTNPMSDIRHNTPVLLCIAVGAVVVAATLSVGLAWMLRLLCCAGSPRASRKRKLDHSTWSPSANTSSRIDKACYQVERPDSLHSVTVKGDNDDLEAKDAKLDALFADSNATDYLGTTMPVLSYVDGNNVPEAPKSTWNGKGWTLFDPPVAFVQPPQPAVIHPPSTARGGGGNYAAARQELADRDVGGFTWPSSIDRQPSFIERLVQRHHQASELPAAAVLPYPFQAKDKQPASRMASLGGAANRAVMNMLPVNLRNAATTASRQRATRKRYHDMQPYLDSDFEGTIGAKDRELPMARRLRATQGRFAVECTTEEESNSPLPNVASATSIHPLASYSAQILPVMIPSPRISTVGKNHVECTPGLAGVGAAWSRRASHQSSLIGPHVSGVIKSSAATCQPPKMIEPNCVSILPLPALQGDRRTRMLGSVGRWLGQVNEAGKTVDPYTVPSPRPDHRLTKNGSLRSDYTSMTLTESATVSSRTQASGRPERLLQRVDANQAEHDRQQRRLLRNARLNAPASAQIDAVSEHMGCSKGADLEDTAANVSRAPSIRPHFFATTDLQNWLEPSKLFTSHGLELLEEQDAVSSVAADPFASDAEIKQAVPAGKPKLRSSRSKQNLRSPAVRDAGRQKREVLRPVNSGLSKKGSHEMLPSATQTSGTVTAMSSVFDEAFASQLNKTARNASAVAKTASERRRQDSQSNEEAKAIAKAEADAAMRDAWRRRRMLSISSRGSQRSRTTRATLSSLERAGALLSREESMRSQPSLYSELTAPSDYQFRAPLLSVAMRTGTNTSCGASTIDPVSAGQDEAELEATEVPHQPVEARKRGEKKRAKKQMKKQTKREKRRVERQRDGEALAASHAPISPDLSSKSGSATSLGKADANPEEASGANCSIPAMRSQVEAVAQQKATRELIKKQRSVSLGMARSQLAALSPYDDVSEVRGPESPLTSSDSDISVRRWGQLRRDDSVSVQGRVPRHHHTGSVPTAAAEIVSATRKSMSKQARANSYYYDMSGGSDQRGFC